MNWAGFLMAVVGPLAKQVLLSIGIGVITYVGMDAAVSAALSAAQSQLGSLPSAVIQILAIGGVWTAMSIVCGGVMARLSLLMLSKLGRVA